MMSVLQHGVRKYLCCLHCRRQLTQPAITHIRHQHQQPSKSNVRLASMLAIVPTGLTTVYMYYLYVTMDVEQMQKYIDGEELDVTPYKPTKVKLYRVMPTRAISRAWGRMNNVDLPMWLREPVYNTYSWLFGCRLSEAAVQDLQHYKNLGEFFKRRLKPSARPIDQSHSLTSPADGKVLHFGTVDRGLVEQVKGVTYSLRDFLGPKTWHDDNNTSPTDTRDSLSSYHNNVKCGTNTELYQCVIYLAPGDYHGFHSPTHWTMAHRRHFPGDLLSVSPYIAKRVQGLFNYNERAIYYGKWQHGFFAFAAVGATNVGSIKVFNDKELQTNVKGRIIPGCFNDEVFVRPDTQGITMQKGESLGEFNLGSTIVLIFEAPRTFKFNLERGQKIYVGQPVGHYE